MISNSNHINKTNKHLSPQITERKKKTTAYSNGNTGRGL